MEGPMHAVENGILLIVVVAAGTVAARRLRLDPQIVLVLILPPLLYAAAFQTSLPAFRANLRPILLLAVGLTLFSTVVVGLVVALAVDWLRRRIADPIIDHTMSLVAPFAAYLPPEVIGDYGVLAV